MSAADGLACHPLLSLPSHLRKIVAGGLLSALLAGNMNDCDSLRRQANDVLTRFSLLLLPHHLFSPSSFFQHAARVTERANAYLKEADATPIRVDRADIVWWWSKEKRQA